MARKRNIHGGGAKTNKNGLQFEQNNNLLNLIEKYKDEDNNSVFSVENNIIEKDNKIIAYYYEKYNFYLFLEANGIQWKQYLSSRLLPDSALYVIRTNTMYK